MQVPLEARLLGPLPTVLILLQLGVGEASWRGSCLASLRSSACVPFSSELRHAPIPDLKAQDVAREFSCLDPVADLDAEVRLLLVLLS